MFNLIGENLGILIGKHGQTLDSLQYLSNLAANKGMMENKVRIIIDIENYRSRREGTLRRLALRLADRTDNAAGRRRAADKKRAVRAALRVENCGRNCRRRVFRRVCQTGRSR